MDTSPSSIARQVGSRITAAGIRVEAAEGWGISDTGRPVEGWQAVAASVKIQLPSKSEQIAAAIVARLAAAGADARVLPVGMTQTVQIQFTVTDDSAFAVTGFDASDLPRRSSGLRSVGSRCAVCGGSMGDKDRKTLTCSPACASQKRSDSQKAVMQRAPRKTLTEQDKKEIREQPDTMSAQEIAEYTGFSLQTVYRVRGRSGTRTQLEVAQRRRRVVELYDAGVTAPAEIARQLGIDKNAARNDVHIMRPGQAAQSPTPRPCKVCLIEFTPEPPTPSTAEICSAECRREDAKKRAADYRAARAQRAASDTGAQVNA
jgi:hypothetical protein